MNTPKMVGLRLIKEIKSISDSAENTWQKNDEENYWYTFGKVSDDVLLTVTHHDDTVRVIKWKELNPQRIVMTVRIITGDCREMRDLPDKSVHCVVTSPPYFGLRDYGTATWEGGDPDCSHTLDAETLDRWSGRSSGSTLVGTTTHQEQAAIARHDCKCGAQRVDNQIGLEQTPQEYVHQMVLIFREVRRVLRDDGTVWLNLGDSYSSGYRTTQNQQTLRKNGYKQMTLFEDVRPVGIRRKQTSKLFGMLRKGAGRADGNVTIDSPRNRDGITSTDIPGKNLMGIPWRVAFALQEPYVVPTCVESNVDRAWLAAIMDGEGCIGIRRFDSYREEKQQVYQDGFVVYTSVTNNDVPILDRCIEVTGYGKSALKQAAASTDRRGIVSRRDSYGWRLDGNKAVAIIRAVYPYLVAKRKQACIGYTLDQLNKYGHGSRAVPAEIQEKKVLLWELMKSCNQRETVDLPGWVEEPKQEIQPGWFLRQDIVWSKPNPLPESVTDRCTKSHEFIFLLTKKDRYFFDADAIAEPVVKVGTVGHLTPGAGSYQNERHTPDKSKKAAEHGNGGGRTDIDNHPSGGWAPRRPAAISAAPMPKRSRITARWTWSATTTRLATKGTYGWSRRNRILKAHFATFPPALIVAICAGRHQRKGMLCQVRRTAGATGRARWRFVRRTQGQRHWRSL